MKIVVEEFPDVYTDKMYVHITYLAEENKGDTEQSLCDYIELKHGLIDREVVLVNGLWGRTVRITKKREKK
jgi:hypothetical protein